jgi:hypothetical protein
VIVACAPTIWGSSKSGFFLFGVFGFGGGRLLAPFGGGDFGFLQNFPRHGLVGAGLVGRLLQLGPLQGLGQLGPLQGLGQFGPLHGFEGGLFALFLSGQFGPLQGLTFEGFFPGQLGPLHGLSSGLFPGQFGPLHGFGQFGPLHLGGLFPLSPNVFCSYSS